MKILYHHRIASKDGQYVHINEIVSAMSLLGHEVHLVGPSVSENSDFGSDGGFVSKLKSMLPKSVYEIAELSYGFVIAAKLISKIIKEKPDVIYERYNLYQPVGVIISKLTNTPIILEVNAPLRDERIKFSNGLAFPVIAKKIEYFTWRMANHVLPVNEVLAKHLVDANVEQKNITVIHNGIKKSGLAKGKEIKQNGEIVVGFVGFMHLTCGVEWAIDVIAATRNKKIKLICVGDGDVVDSLKEKAKMLGLSSQIQFTGLVDRSEVMQYVSKFDIALQPDVTEYASPLKMFEYMLSKCLILAPKKKNIYEILSKSEAVFFDSGEYGFKKALEYAFSNFDELQPKREAAFRKLEKSGFTWEDNVEKIVEIAEREINK